MLALAVPAGARDPNRDLLTDFQRAGFSYVANATQLAALPAAAAGDRAR